MDYKAVMEFIQVVTKLWYKQLSQETVKGQIKGGKVGKVEKVGWVADKVMLLQIIICFRYTMLINVNMSNCKYLKCMNVV